MMDRQRRRRRSHRRYNLPIILLPLLALSTQLNPASAFPQNVTIDDEYGDEQTGIVPGYSPVGAWAQGSECEYCLMEPDRLQAYRGTWHDATYTPGNREPRVVSVVFNGTAIYAYFIIVNIVEFATTPTNTIFELDGEPVGPFMHIPTLDETYLYNVPGYVNTTLQPGRHQLNIIGTGDTDSSFISFDYAVYTFDNEASSSTTTSTSTTTTSPDQSTSTPPSQSNSSTSTGAIAGGVVGGLVFLALLGGLLFFCRRKQKRRAEIDLIENLSYQTEPFMDETRRGSHPGIREGVGMVDVSAGGVASTSMSLTSHNYLSQSSVSVSGGGQGAGASTSSLLMLSRDGDRTTLTPSESSHLAQSDAATTPLLLPPLPTNIQPTGATTIGIAQAAGDSEAALRRQELQRRMEGVQNILETLQRQASVGARPRTRVRNHDQSDSISTGQLGDVSDTVSSPLLGTGSYTDVSSQPTTFSGSESRASATESLWHRVAELLAEVERLRAQQGILGLSEEPPPGYYDSGSERVSRS